MTGSYLSCAVCRPDGSCRAPVGGGERNIWAAVGEGKDRWWWWVPRMSFPQTGQARSLLTSEGAFLWIQNDPLVSSMSEVSGWKTHLGSSCRRISRGTAQWAATSGGAACYPFGGEVHFQEALQYWYFPDVSPLLSSLTSCVFLSSSFPVSDIEIKSCLGLGHVRITQQLEVISYLGLILTFIIAFAACE